MTDCVAMKERSGIIDDYQILRNCLCEERKKEIASEILDMATKWCDKYQKYDDQEINAIINHCKVLAA